MGGDGGLLPIHNFERQLLETVCVKGRFERAHFLEQDAHTPDITFEGVLFTLHDFGRELLGRPHHGLHHLVGVGQHLSDPEVTQFDHVALSQEYVLALEVTVEHFTVVDVFHCETNLYKIV